MEISDTEDVLYFCIMESMKTNSVSGFLPLEACSIGIHGFCWQELKFDIVVA